MNSFVNLFIEYNRFSHPNNPSTVIPVFGAQAKTASTAQSDVSQAYRGDGCEVIESFYS